MRTITSVDMKLIVGIEAVDALVTTSTIVVISSTAHGHISNLVEISLVNNME